MRGLGSVPLEIALSAAQIVLPVDSGYDDALLTGCHKLGVHHDASDAAVPMGERVHLTRRTS